MHYLFNCFFYWSHVFEMKKWRQNSNVVHESWSETMMKENERRRRMRKEQNKINFANYCYSQDLEIKRFHVLIKNRKTFRVKFDMKREFLLFYFLFWLKIIGLRHWYENLFNFTEPVCLFELLNIFTYLLII